MVASSEALRVDNGGMRAGRRGRFEVEGHSFAGWEPANTLTAEDLDDIDLIESLQKERVLDIKTCDSLDEKRKRIEGDTIPTCECGWRGVPDDWIPAPSRKHQTSHQHINHKHAEEMKQSRGKLGAEMATAALDHAADAWTGDAEVGQWLRARADHVLDVGYFDGEEWP